MNPTSAVMYGDWTINTYLDKVCPDCLIAGARDDLGDSTVVNKETKTISIFTIELVTPSACEFDHVVDSTFTETFAIES